MTDTYILTADGEVVAEPDLIRWGQWFENATNRQIALDRIGKVEVSTIFLGLNHRFGPGAPLLYETMVFGGSLDSECDRYSTRDEAMTGHAAMVARVKAA